MQQVVINCVYGGFQLSDTGIAFLKDHGSIVPEYPTQIARDDPNLVKLARIAPDQASYCKLEIVEIPDDVEWVIQEYDGAEWVAEKHRTWP